MHAPFERAVCTLDEFIGVVIVSEVVLLSCGAAVTPKNCLRVINGWILR
jgi:hypothetical protein